SDQAISKWKWANPETQQQEIMVPLIQGHHNPTAKQSKIDTMLARSYLFLDDQGLSKVIKRLNPRYLNAKLKNGPSASVPAEFRNRDLLGIWSEYTDFWSSQQNKDRPLIMDGSYLCTKDRRFHVIMLYPQHPAKNMPFCLEVGKRLQTLSENITQDNKQLKVQMMGGYISAAADFQTVRHSLYITFGSSFIGIVLLFGMVYKSLRLIILIAIGLVPAIVATLGITTLLIGNQLTLIATIFAAILVGLGVDFIIHLYNAFCWAISNDNVDRPEAARRAICRVGPSITVGCVTSVSTFAVLATSSFRGLLELGVISSIGLLVILASLMIVVPAFLTLWGPRKAVQPKGLYGYGKLITSRPILMSTIAISLIVISMTTLAIAPKIFTLDDDLRNLRPYNKKSEDTIKSAAELGIRFGTHRVTIFGQGSEAVLNETLSFISSLDHLRKGIPFTLNADLSSDALHAHDDITAIQGIDYSNNAVLARYIIMTPWGRCHVKSIENNMLTDIELVEDEEFDNSGKAIIKEYPIIPAGTQLELMPLLGPSQLDQITFISPKQQHHNLNRLRDEVDWQAINNTLQKHSDKETKYTPFFKDMRELSLRVSEQSLLLPKELAQSSMRSVIDSFYSSDGTNEHIMLQLNILHDRTFIPLDEFRAAMNISLQDNGLPAQKNGFTIGTFGIPTISNYMQKTIVGDFVSLTSIAMGLVLIVLFIGVRQPLHVLLAITTLGAGLLITLAIMRACNTPWNVLNIAVVPLVIGIGIDNSVHFLHCLKHHSFDKQGIINTINETGHPIMMTALTSIIGFTSLLLNSYRGIQGIGALAAIGIFACMVSALLGLPLLILGVNKLFNKD
ncbi:MAG: MMPL family transporter, partial [Planctomycetes bacterium]|nr:MMPL family transporter [Planctomycetota bacterium]